MDGMARLSRSSRRFKNFQHAARARADAQQYRDSMRMRNDRRGNDARRLAYAKVCSFSEENHY